MDLLNVERTEIPSREDKWSEHVRDLLVSELQPLRDVLNETHEYARAMGWSLVRDVVEPFVHPFGCHCVHVNVDAQHDFGEQKFGGLPSGEAYMARQLSHSITSS